MSQLQAKEIEVKYLTEEQVAALFGVIHGPRDKALFRLIYHRGLRASEPGLLMMADWDSSNASMWVHRKKGSESGRYHLIPVEATAVRAWIKKRGIVPGPLFTTRNHTAISRDQVHHLMRQYCQLAGVSPESAHPHALKHSCGTHVLARVKDLSVVQKWLGHRSIQSTEIYAKVLNLALAEATAQLRDWK